MINLNFFNAENFIRNGNGHEAGRRNTTHTTKCCRKLMALSRICAANFPIPRKPSADVKKSCAVLRPARIPNAPGCCWRIISRNFPSRARIFPDTNWWPRLLNAHGQNATGRTRISFSARETFRAAGIANARQPGPFCQSRGSRAGTQTRSGTGKLALAARHAAARYAARDACASSAARSRTRKNRRAIGSPCNFFCRARARAKRRARCTT